MQTELDAQIVGWVGCLGAAGAEHVMGRFEMGRSWAYARLNQLVEDGLLEQRSLLYQRPGLYVATRAGLRWRGLTGLEVARVAVELCQALPDGWDLISEREIRARERDSEELLASVQIAARAGGRPALHRPDLALISPAGRVAAVEVELSVKTRARLEGICTGWARARHLQRVYYLAAPSAARAVRRAIKRTRTEDRVTVLALDQPAALADRAEREEADHVAA
jgi:hypothetical protein